MDVQTEKQIEKMFGENLAKKLFEIEELSEVKLRLGQKVIAVAASETVLLDETADEKTIARVLNFMTDGSAYAFERSLRKGFAAKDGIRVGIAGSGVYDKGVFLCFEKITSLAVRFMRREIHIEDKLFKLLESEREAKSVLILAPPAAGKTTFLRALAKRLSKSFSLVALDERGEICFGESNFFDVLKGVDRKTGFEIAICSLSANVVAVDEIYSEEDFELVKKAAKSGVKVLATMHASGIEDYKERSGAKKLFDRYVVLSGRIRKGTVEGVFDADFQRL